jgi:DNA helicase-2/ATP-dependent DNA helicase PcrA
MEKIKAVKAASAISEYTAPYETHPVGGILRAMAKMNLEALLNGPQLEAVLTIEGPVLIIAGAGSGKTRVITYRIAHMLEQGIPQSAILALTFTNKAAREMEGRVKELTGRKLQALTISTFHAFGVRILRDEIETLGYRTNFSIYDESDKISLIKECLRECRVGVDGVDCYALSQLFSAVKIGRAAWGEGANGEWEHVYKEYQYSLQVFNALDFDDLLVLPLALFSRESELLTRYRRRYRYLMVDEFQDTSLIQYRLMRMLSGDQDAPNVCVVGDDDQSIYSWRGASYENISAFERDFPGAAEIKLEQNYRSTATILEAANGVISHNTNRKGKRLWSGKGGGRPIIFFSPANDAEEGDLIAQEIRSLLFKEKLRYSDFGVLLRTNSMTRPIEEAFLAANIPCQVSGGDSFFDRAEIRDILAYLRVIANEDDDVNLLRILNTPRRGIGKALIASIGDLARKEQISLWDAMGRLRFRSQTKTGQLTLSVSGGDDEGLEAEKAFQEQGRVEIDEFMTLIEGFQDEILGRMGKGWRLSQKVRALVDRIDYRSYLMAENEKAARWKFLNIESLIQSIETWESNSDNLNPGIYPYLTRISLLTTGDDAAGDENGRGKVNLMTIHAAKGLEFPVVFIAGAEEGLIPHLRTLEEDGDMEEERRLFYVAITRAQSKLYISACQKRRRLKETLSPGPSPFLAEIPPHLVSFQDLSDAGPAEEAEVDDFFAALKSHLKE